MPNLLEPLCCLGNQAYRAVLSEFGVVPPHRTSSNYRDAVASMHLPLPLPQWFVSAEPIQNTTEEMLQARSGGCDCAGPRGAPQGLGRAFPDPW